MRIISLLKDSLLTVQRLFFLLVIYQGANTRASADNRLMMRPGVRSAMGRQSSALRTPFFKLVFSRALGRRWHLSTDLKSWALSMTSAFNALLARAEPILHPPYPIPTFHAVFQNSHTHMATKPTNPLSLRHHHLSSLLQDAPRSKHSPRNPIPT